MTWIELADTAIKIGLGALISAVATYLTLKQGHKHERVAENARRKLDLIERVAQKFDVFVIAFENYVISVPLVGDLKAEYADLYKQRVQRQLQLSSNDVVDCKDNAKTSHEASHEILQAITLLRLLAAPDAVAATKQYRTVAERFWLATSDILDQGVDVNEFVKLRIELSAAKQVVYDHLGKLYPAE